MIISCVWLIILEPVRSRLLASSSVLYTTGDSTATRKIKAGIERQKVAVHGEAFKSSSTVPEHRCVGFWYL